MAKKDDLTQYAALPITVRDGQLRVLLVTSRETRRWIIPKGWPEKKTLPHSVAAREAYEEAGLIGRVGEKPFAVFRYQKRLKGGKFATCSVETYLFEVDRELDDWPEKGERERQWVTPAEAALLVGDDGLVRIMLELAAPSD